VAKILLMIALQASKLLDTAAKNLNTRALEFSHGQAGAFSLGSSRLVKDGNRDSVETRRRRGLVVPNSVLDAIKLGQWDFEPEQVPENQFDATRALPGSNAKLAIMAERLRQGLPLWHPEDPLNFDDLQAARDERRN
jgi:hypothetical protein